MAFWLQNPLDPNNCSLYLYIMASGHHPTGGVHFATNLSVRLHQPMSKSQSTLILRVSKTLIDTECEFVDG